MLQKKPLKINKIYSINGFVLTEEQFQNCKKAFSPRGYLVGFLGREEAKMITNQQIKELLMK